MDAKKEDKGTATPDRVPALPRPARPSLLGRAVAVPWWLLRGLVRMNHETKAGLVVSASFLCLVGIVLYAKMQEQQAVVPPAEYQEYVKTDENGELQAQLPDEPTPSVANGHGKASTQLVPTTVLPLKNVPVVIQASGQVPADNLNATGSHSSGSRTAVNNGTKLPAAPDAVSVESPDLSISGGLFSDPTHHTPEPSTGTHVPAKPTPPSGTRAPTQPISTKPARDGDHKGNVTDRNVPAKTSATGATNTTTPPAVSNLDAANSAAHAASLGTSGSLGSTESVKPQLVHDNHVKPAEIKPLGEHDPAAGKVGGTVTTPAAVTAPHNSSIGIGVPPTKPHTDTGLSTARPTPPITMPSPDKLKIDAPHTGAQPTVAPVVSVPDIEKPKPNAAGAGTNGISGAGLAASVQLSTPRPAGTSDAITKPPVHLAPPAQVAQADPQSFGSARPGLTSSRPVAVPSSPAAPARVVTQVGSWDEDIYHCSPVDTFDQISQRYYSSTRYAQALLMFNRDRQPSADGLQQNPPVLSSGGLIYVPPARVLEEKYPNVIQGYQRPPATTASSLYHPASTVSALQYKVGPGGDTFFQIAQRTLGDGDTRWGDIYRLNPKYDPQQRIPAGAILALPPDAHIDSSNAVR